MKKSLVFAMAMALGVSATAFAANPFSDLPAGHWAYGAVAKLAAAGVVDGYPDGTFKGDKTPMYGFNFSFHPCKVMFIHHL